MVKSVNLRHTITYAKQTGLRSFQNINDEAERTIIQAYKNELTHDIWGNPEKLREWATNKFNELRDKNYFSIKLDNDEIANERNASIKAWANMIEENANCKNNPFFKLKILRSVVDNLKENNAQFPLVISKNVFKDAIYEVKKCGSSFKKTYIKLYEQFYSMGNVVVDDVYKNGIRGKWYSLKVPNHASSSQSGLLKKVRDFISILSQDSNWCTRTPKAINENFLGMDFHIFVDSKGCPQLCIVGTDKYGGQFKYIKGNNQYAPIPDKFKAILKSFLEMKKLDKALVGETDSSLVPVLDICK